MTATQQPKAKRVAACHVERTEDEAGRDQSDLRLQRTPKQQFLADAGGNRDHDDLPHADAGEQRLQQLAVRATDGPHGA